MRYDERTDDLINQCVEAFIRAGAREHAQAIITLLRGLHYERALIEARRYVKQVLAQEINARPLRVELDGQVPQSRAELSAVARS